MVRLLAIALFAFVLPAAAAPTDEDFARFLSYWPGAYDNLAQVKEQEAAGRAASDRNQATLLFIRRVDLLAFGPNTYYAEWQAAADTTRIIRQRIYGFGIDRGRGKFRLDLHIWPADKPEFVARTAGAHHDPSKLNGVIPSDMAGLKGCGVFFETDAEGFSGAMDRGACAFDAPNGAPVYSWSQMTVSASAFRYLDGWFNLDGTPFMRFSQDWYVFEKRAGGTTLLRVP